jgi:hypothetical protein
MTEEIEKLIRKSMAKDIELKILQAEIEGVKISREFILKTLKDLTN